MWSVSPLTKAPLAHRWGKGTIVAVAAASNIIADPDRDLIARVEITGDLAAQAAAVYRLLAADPFGSSKEPDRLISCPQIGGTFPRFSATLLVLRSSRSV